MTINGLINLPDKIFYWPQAIRPLLMSNPSLQGPVSWHMIQFAMQHLHILYYAFALTVYIIITPWFNKTKKIGGKHKSPQVCITLAYLTFDSTKKNPGKKKFKSWKIKLITCAVENKQTAHVLINYVTGINDSWESPRQSGTNIKSNKSSNLNT